MVEGPCATRTRGRGKIKHISIAGYDARLRAMARRALSIPCEIESSLVQEAMEMGDGVNGAHWGSRYIIRAPWTVFIGRSAGAGADGE